MIAVKILDVPGYTGEYEWDEAKGFTGHELHLIKKVSGVRLGEISEAMNAGDYDVIVAVAAIVIWRAGRVTKDRVPSLVDELLDAEGGKIIFGTPEEAEEEDPPARPEPESENGSSGDAPENSPRSSSFSRSAGVVPPATIPLRTGRPGSVTGAT